MWCWISLQGCLTTCTIKDPEHTAPVFFPFYKQENLSSQILNISQKSYESVVAKKDVWVNAIFLSALILKQICHQFKNR